MHIIDLEGVTIKITDLKATIAQVNVFLSYETRDEIPSVQRFNERRMEYWKDFHAKLLKLVDSQNDKP